MDRKDLTVTKHNHLNEACYKLTLDERRLILTSIANVRSDRKITEDIEITARDFAEMWGIDERIAYKQLKEAKENLYERSVKLKKLDTGEVWDIRWIDAAAYQDGEGYIKISFSNKIRPYLEELKSHFTSYRLAEIKHFKSGHAIRLYELLMQYRTTGWREVELGWLKKYFGVENKYRRWVDFRKRVIDPAQKEINTLSAYDIDYETIKSGRAITKLKFFFYEKKARVTP